MPSECFRNILSRRRVSLSVRDVYITDELLDRLPSKRDHADENLVFQDITPQLVSGPSELLPRVVDVSHRAV
jgi:hypothetical protein